MVGIIRRACNMACNDVENKLEANTTLEEWRILRTIGEHVIVLDIRVKVEEIDCAIEVGATIDLDLDTIDLQ